MDTLAGQRTEWKKFLARHLNTTNDTDDRFEYTYDEVHKVLEAAKDTYKNVLALEEINPQCVIVGDIHGQFRDLLRMFGLFNENKEKDPRLGVTRSKFLFLGDYVDRGGRSLECVLLVLVCRILYGRRYVLLRGNHECKAVNRVYGFYDELHERFKKDEATKLFDEFNELFAWLPLAGLVGGKILCMHGGIGPELLRLDDIRAIPRPLDDPINNPIAMSLLWADPVQGQKWLLLNEQTPFRGFMPNTLRGVSVFFGEDTVTAFCQHTGIELIVRAHQVMQSGYGFFANRKLVTIFTAPRYYAEKNNKGAVMVVNADSTIGFKILVPPHLKFGPNTATTFQESMDSEAMETSYVTAVSIKKNSIPKAPAKKRTA